MVKRWFGSVQSRLMEGPTQVTPVVGMGCTITLYTDRHAATVVEILSPSRIVVQRDKATRTNKNGMSDCQDYAYERNPNGAKSVFTKRRDGRWREHKGTNGLVLNHRNEYFDYSF